jgi:cytochrome c heme-lyase
MLSDVLDQAVLLNRQNPTDDDGSFRNISSTTTDNHSRRPDNRAMASNDAGAAAACPVDHKSREAWMEQARQAAASSTSSSSSSAALPAFQPPVQPAAAANGAEQETCPVDHKARDVCMQQVRAAGSAVTGPAAPSSAVAAAAVAPSSSATTSSSSSWTWSILSHLPFGSSSTTNAPKPPPTSSLGTAREVSTIPRTEMLATAAAAAAGANNNNTTHASPLPPANKEQETGADAASGNWIYPSERMFFDAMKRKGHDPRSSDMQTIVPIHNAVNERAWADIKRWEEPYTRGTR